jgi:membrane peptidoglycan carboxypeptidase
MIAPMLERLCPGWLSGFRTRLRSDLSIIEKHVHRDPSVASPRLTPLEQMVIVLEDRRFFRHAGVDIRSVIREVYKKLSRRKHGGASTIDMQFVRTATNYRDRTFRRKTYESLLSTLIQFRYGKRVILRSYLACAYLGTGLNNANQAAQKIFAKAANRLDLEEAAFIAALLAYPRPRNGSAEWERKARHRAAYAMTVYRSKGARHFKVDLWASSPESGAETAVRALP